MKSFRVTVVFPASMRPQFEAIRKDGEQWSAFVRDLVKGDFDAFGDFARVHPEHALRLGPALARSLMTPHA